MIWPANFMRFGRKGRDLPYLRFIIKNDAEITKARLAMVQGVLKGTGADALNHCQSRLCDICIIIDNEA